jgi:hypothetical protein
MDGIPQHDEPRSFSMRSSSKYKRLIKAFLSKLLDIFHLVNVFLYVLYVVPFLLSNLIQWLNNWVSPKVVSYFRRVSVVLLRVTCIQFSIEFYHREMYHILSCFYPTYDPLFANGHTHCFLSRSVTVTMGASLLTDKSPATKWIKSI